MATMMDQEGSSGPGALDSASPLERVTSNPPIRRSRSRGWLALGLPLVALIGLVAAAWPQIAGWATSEQQTGALVHTVTRGPLVLTVTENGNVESASNVDVKCRVQGGSTILWIVEDGKQVQKGEKIVELDPSTISDLLNAQKILFQRARATKIQAEKEYEAARIAVEEYRNGLFVKELQSVETLRWIGQRNLSSAKNILQHTEVMYRKGFVTDLQLKADMASVEQAALELATAETGKDVLVNFTKAKMIAQLESLRDSAEARTASERAALKLEQDRLDYLEQQLGNCVVYAPQSGMVIYANEKSRRAPQVQIDEGVAVLAQQTIIRIPDLSHMQVKVAVHETKVEQIKPGMTARIVIQDRELRGTVSSIANQPEATSYYTAHIKEYPTVVKIEGDVYDLKPGMSAEVEILIDRLEDVLSVPVQVVVEQDAKFYCWVQTPEGPQRRPVVLGQTDDKMIEIKDGVKAGEKVLLNPRAYVAEAREEGLPTEEDEEKNSSPASE